MPKIDAATVAEHHAMRRAEVIAAARQVLGAGGVSAVTPAAVAKRAGLARTSVYQYYPSTEKLLAAAIESMFELAAEQVRLALHGSSGPWRRVRAYVNVALRAAAGEFGTFSGLTFSELPVEAQRSVREHYRELTRPLTDAIAGLAGSAIAEPAITTRLVLGVIGAAIADIRDGQDPATVSDTTLSFLAAALGHEPDGER
jgi:AcrR family transcriptional regulator